MRISELLSRKRAGVVHVPPSAPVGPAVELMKERQIGAVLVIDADGRLTGMLSERDVVHALASDPAGLLARPVSEVARSEGPVAALEDTVQRIMEVMTVTRARHVPVVRFGRVVGIVSIGDVIKSRLDEKTFENAVLQEIARAQFFAH